MLRRALCPCASKHKHMLGEPGTWSRDSAIQAFKGRVFCGRRDQRRPMFGPVLRRGGPKLAHIGPGRPRAAETEAKYGDAEANVARARPDTRRFRTWVATRSPSSARHRPSQGRLRPMSARRRPNLGPNLRRVRPTVGAPWTVAKEELQPTTCVCLFFQRPRAESADAAEQANAQSLMVGGHERTGKSSYWCSCSLCGMLSVVVVLPQRPVNFVAASRSDTQVEPRRGLRRTPLCRKSRARRPCQGQNAARTSRSASAASPRSSTRNPCNFMVDGICAQALIGALEALGARAPRRSARSARCTRPQQPSDESAQCPSSSAECAGR